MSKIKASALLLCAGLSIGATSASAQTLDSLITKQREALIEEANKKGLADKGIPNASAAPQQLQISQTAAPVAQLPALPDFGLPGMAAPGLVPPPKPITKAVFSIADAKLVAVYGVGENLTAEIAYNGYVSRVGRKMEVIDGWIVQEITGRTVQLAKAVKSGKSVGIETHILRFNQGTGVVTTQTIQPKAPKVKKTATRLAPESAGKPSATLGDIAASPVAVASAPTPQATPTKTMPGTVSVAPSGK
jgi:hypothetical protein